MFVNMIGSDADGMYLRFAEQQERRAADLEAAVRQRAEAKSAFEQSNSSSAANEPRTPRRAAPIRASERTSQLIASCAPCRIRLDVRSAEPSIV
jgi:hypothetical protein